MWKCKNCGLESEDSVPRCPRCRATKAAFEAVARVKDHGPTSFVYNPPKLFDDQPESQPKSDPPAEVEQDASVKGRLMSILCGGLRLTNEESSKIWWGLGLLLLGIVISFKYNAIRILM
jgi:rubredoxin